LLAAALAARRSAGPVARQAASAEANGSEPLYCFDGQPSTYAQATRDIGAIQAKLRSDVRRPATLTLDNCFTPRGRQLDRMSIVFPVPMSAATAGAWEVVSLIYEYEDGLRKRPGFSTL
jgi:hypothetical protein